MDRSARAGQAYLYTVEVVQNDGGRQEIILGRIHTGSVIYLPVLGQP